jgi:amino acid adenylation domain-containing protein
VADAETGVWQLVEEAAARYPERIAVRDSDPRGTLTYQQLLDAVVAHSSALAAAGAAEEDRVAFAGARSAREIVSLLAILRLGASYVGIDPLAPQEVVAAMLGLVNPRVVVGDAAAIGKLGPAIGGYRTLECTDPSTAENGQAPPAAVPDPSRIAYIAFSSGSTGRPKGIMVPHRAVVRLVRDPQYLRAGAAERFLRLAPLAFDASTLEIFAPLAAGGTIEIYPPQDVTPAALAAFAHQRRLTGMWLTAGLFRVIADHRPDAFTGLRQLLTGGDIVPSSQVRRVLQRCPGLRVTNGYGPTENTTFTTVHHVDDPAELKGAVPVGQPVPGTSVLIVDRSGKLVPPGGIGELYVYGTGLALGYLGLQAETAASFGYLTSETNDVVYRTGDVVRWDHAGRLEFLGRRDHQVKIRGFRIELDAITDLVREHPAVRDAVVVATLSDVSDRRLLAAVVAEPAPGLVAELRRFASARLPAYAVPSLWVITDPLPVTANGKLDAARLERLALGGREEQPQSAAAILAGAQPAAEPDTLEAAISRIWQRVLGNETFNPDARFFDVGGDSIRLLRVHAQLAKLVPGTELHIGDLYKFPTIRALARHLGSQASSLRGSGEDDPLAIIQHNVLAVRNNPRWAEMTQICVRQDRKGRAWQQFLHHAIHDLCPLVRS